MATFETFISTLSADEHVRGRQFERICKWFLTHDPHYSGIVERVWLWDEWPDRWGADAGIDLVAEGRDGVLWAVQAKAYGEESTVSKRDIDTFLSESARPQFGFRLLIATTDRLSRNAERVLSAQEKPSGRLLRSGLKKSSVVWPASVDNLQAPMPARATPRPHQVEAVDAVVEGFAAGTTRGQLLMACGTGKTLTALWVRERLRARRTLVLVPSLSLLSQTMREWTAQSASYFESLPVCSDESVRGVDSLVSHTSELAVPVTTEPARIEEFLRGESERVVFCTYHSAPRVAQALQANGVPEFDLVVADEAHRCAGRITADFATVLDDDLLPSRRRLFMTATPRYFTGRVRRAASEVDQEVASMDDERLFGPVLHSLSFGEAIRRDLLTDYQVVVIGVDQPTIRDYAQNGRLVTREGEVTDAGLLASEIGLAKAMRDYDLTRSISFHSRVEKARRFASMLPDVVEWMPSADRPTGSVQSESVSGRIPSGQRDIRLNRLRHLPEATRGLLANARCLSEGVDIPTLDGVAFIDPRRSQVDIVQAVGRAIRKASDKHLGTIVLPIFIAPEDDVETALESSAFQPVWSVLKALRAHDEALAESLDAMRRSLGRGNGVGPLPSKFILDLPSSVDQRFADAITAKLVETTTSSWEFWFGLLERYVSAEGTALVPAWYTVEGLKLGLWVSNQRARRTQLPPPHVASLESLPGWVWHARSSKWDRGYRLLGEFAETEGHANPGQSVVVDGFPLGSWTNTQRTQYRGGDMQTARAERLEALPGWTWEPLESRWDQAYEVLRKYAIDVGHAQVPAQCKVDDFKLGVWVGSQRNRYRQGIISRERVEALESVPGWTWQGRTDWDDKFSMFEQHVAEGGSTRPGRGVVVGEFKLGEWVAKQRGIFRAGEMAEGRIAQMESVPGWSWNPAERAWEDGFNALMAFSTEEGHSRPTRSVTVNEIRIGQWVASQRTAYRQGRLSDERAHRLEALPGWAWSKNDWVWDRAYEQLTAFGQEFGHSSVADDFTTEDGTNLGTWVAAQRRLHRTGSLADERVERLEALPGWVWNPVADKWHDAHSTLLQYVATEGTITIARDLELNGIRLGRWIEVQRRQYRAGSLSPSRIELLEAVDGWTWNVEETPSEG